MQWRKYRYVAYQRQLDKDYWLYTVDARLRMMALIIEESTSQLHWRLQRQRHVDKAVLASFVLYRPLSAAGSLLCVDGFRSSVCLTGSGWTIIEVRWQRVSRCIIALSLLLELSTGWCIYTSPGVIHCAAMMRRWRRKRCWSDSDKTPAAINPRQQNPDEQIDLIKNNRGAARSVQVDFMWSWCAAMCIVEPWALCYHAIHWWKHAFHCCRWFCRVGRVCLHPGLHGWRYRRCAHVQVLASPSVLCLVSVWHRCADRSLIAG